VAKKSVPRRRPLVESECHSPLPIWPHLSIPGERQLRPAACRERPDGASRGRITGTSEPGALGSLAIAVRPRNRAV
jgi:hypothetical protein